MAIELEGGCRVVGLKEGEPQRDGALRIWNHFARAFSMRVLELDGEATLANDALDEVLYVLECGGHAAALITPARAAAWPPHSIAANTSLFVPAGTALTLRGRMTLVSCQCPPTHGRPAIVALDAKPMQRTGDRWYRELVSAEVTQFVGAIPPGRAPDHFHLYEEVICILDGGGAMWAGASSTPIESGSCIFLPRRQMHCVENRGTTELRLLGVFYPAGSPAVRYSS